jgi:hypothetical protein
MINSKLLILIFCLFAISAAEETVQCGAELTACMADTDCMSQLTSLSSCPTEPNKAMLCQFNLFIAGSASSNSVTKNYFSCTSKIITDATTKSYESYETL